VKRHDLVNARLRRGLTQRALAEHAEISRETVRRAENGDGITPTTAGRIATVLGVTPGYVLGIPEDRGGAA
jgi:transcriptional regulator with XRE-family HTH domain